MASKYKYTTARQWGGDDGYQWAVFVKGDSYPVVCGLTLREVNNYRVKIEREESEKRKGKRS